MCILLEVAQQPLRNILTNSVTLYFEESKWR